MMLRDARMSGFEISSLTSVRAIVPKGRQSGRVAIGKSGMQYRECNRADGAAIIRGDVVSSTQTYHRTQGL